MELTKILSIAHVRDSAIKIEVGDFPAAPIILSNSISQLSGAQLLIRLPFQLGTPSWRNQQKMSLFSKIVGLPISIFVFSWDFLLLILNELTPSLKSGNVVPLHAKGHNLTWPEYVPPKEGDSRSACPMLNAMANHGILPHDGKNIPFTELSAKIRQTFNFASTFCYFVPKLAADFLNRSYWTGRLDLEELSLHNAIEHDASLTRQDTALVPDQGKSD